MIDKLKSSLKRGFIGDLLFKMIANIISTIIRNIVVLPFLANIFVPAEYGEIITVVGVITTISAGLGNALLSTRLVLDSEYREAKIEGDFNIICIVVSTISIIFALPITKYFSYTGFEQIVLVALILFTETFVGYHSGWFILRQEYRKLLVYTIIGGSGFAVGLLISSITKMWTFTYLMSDIFSMVFLIRFSPLIKEKLCFTIKCPILLQKYGILFLSTLISNALSYLDRLMLYPVIGSEAVAIYSTASVFGKAFNLIALPISSIMLGYYAAGKIRLDRKKYWYVNLSTLIILGVFIVITRVVGVWFTGILYPSIIESARPFVMIANISSAIAASAQITKSAALKYAKTYWTLVIQFVYAVIYMGLGYFMVLKFGLAGFSYSVLSANLIQLVMLYIICDYALKSTD